MQVLSHRTPLFTKCWYETLRTCTCILWKSLWKCSMQFFLALCFHVLYNLVDTLLVAYFPRGVRDLWRPLIPYMYLYYFKGQKISIWHTFVFTTASLATYIFPDPEKEIKKKKIFWICSSLVILSLRIRNVCQILMLSHHTNGSPFANLFDIIFSWDKHLEIGYFASW